MRAPISAVLGFVVLVAAGIALAPAASLDRPLASATHERVRLTGAEGFWWRGHGVLTTGDGAARLPIAWRVAIAPLFTGMLVVDLASGGDDAMPSGTVALRHGTLEVRDLRLYAPAAFVPALVPALKTLALGGDVALQAPAFAWRDGTGTGAFDATWQRARVVAGIFALDLGVVSASAVPKGDALAGTLRNRGGDVAIDGTVNDRAGILDATLALKPNSSASEVVRTILPLLGTSDGAGGVRVTWRSDR